ncbi:uncharacterized protein [Montipora foliosa]|uniref:uncharacterized protein n=1 Tax=Montipora foliosa TaxID=591990 RepID=UPI0035F2155D
MTSNQVVTWHWNPPSTPHFGGVFEAMPIKSSKRAIYAILKDADIHWSRRRNKFKTADRIERRPERRASTYTESLPYWRRVQELTRHVWGRWMKEYLHHIGSRQKWFFPTENLKVGDVVMVIDPSAARREWKVGRIERTNPGSDQLVRVVDVRVGDKSLKRSVTRISPLEFAETD